MGHHGPVGTPPLGHAPGHSLDQARRHSWDCTRRHHLESLRQGTGGGRSQHWHWHTAGRRRSHGLLLHGRWRKHVRLKLQLHRIRGKLRRRGRFIFQVWEELLQTGCPISCILQHRRWLAPRMVHRAPLLPPVLKPYLRGSRHETQPFGELVDQRLPWQWVGLKNTLQNTNLRPCEILPFATLGVAGIRRAVQIARVVRHAFP